MQQYISAVLILVGLWLGYTSVHSYRVYSGVKAIAAEAEAAALRDGTPGIADFMHETGDNITFPWFKTIGCGVFAVAAISIGLSMLSSPAANPHEEPQI